MVCPFTETFYMREADALYYSTHMWSVTAMDDYIRRLGHDLYAWNLKSSTSGTTARTEVINPGMDRAWGFYERPAKSVYSGHSDVDVKERSQECFAECNMGWQGANGTGKYQISPTIFPTWLKVKMDT
jgi:hypothetical protein